jgi:hypothetical protein
VIAALLAGVDPAELAGPRRSSASGRRRSRPYQKRTQSGGQICRHRSRVASVALRTADSFEESPSWAVNLGGDSGTNGAVAGGWFGAAAIPLLRVEKLAVRDEAEVLGERVTLLGQSDIRLDNATRRRRGSNSSIDGAARLKQALKPFAGALAHGPEARHAAERAITDSSAFGRGRMFVSNVPDAMWCTYSSGARSRTGLKHLQQQPESVLRVSPADKLFDARAILRDYLVVAHELWARFNPVATASCGPTANSPTASARSSPARWLAT